MNSKRMMLAAALITVLLLAGLVSVLPAARQATAAPNALATPVTVYAGRGGTLLNFYSASARTADGGSAQSNVLNGEKLDVQTVIDQGTTNTVTLKLQFSNDGTNWSDGQTVVSANAADATAIGQYNVFGAYARLYVDVTNSNPLTITASGVLR